MVFQKYQFRVKLTFLKWTITRKNLPPFLSNKVCYCPNNKQILFSVSSTCDQSIQTSLELCITSCGTRLNNPEDICAIFDCQVRCVSAMNGECTDIKDSFEFGCNYTLQMMRTMDPNMCLDAQCVTEVGLVGSAKHRQLYDVPPCFSASRALTIWQG